MNTYLYRSGEVISQDPSLWKYYLNLSGQPYIGSKPENSDPTNISVYSLDTGQLIPFTVTSLAANPMTLADFQTLGTSFTDLLAQYPTQRTLLYGVINPVDTVTAIAAGDCQILFYNKNYIDPNEVNLIPKLQQFLNNFVSRYDNGNYAVTDVYYPAVLKGLTTLALVMEVVNIRLENCHTIYVHQWHVWSYLSGYFDLAKHKNIISYDQALFLYRNIDYMIANSGTSLVLNLLNEKFCLPFNLQLYSFSVQKSMGSALTKLNAGTLEGLTPDIKIIQYPYGESIIDLELATQLTPAEFVNLLTPSGLRNSSNTNIDIESLIAGIETSQPNDIITGVILGDVVNNILVDLIDQTMEQINQWFYLATNGFIKYKIALDLADVNSNNFIITASDAAALYIYASAVLQGTWVYDSANVASFSEHLTGIPIPSVTTTDIMLSPLYSQSQLTSKLESSFLRNDTSNPYSVISSNQTLPQNILSLSDFTSHIGNVVGNKITHLMVINNESDMHGRSELTSLVQAFYSGQTNACVSDANYNDFFVRLGLSPESWTAHTFNEIITQIANNFMGIQLETSTLQSPYSNMLDILTQICSYTVTFIAGPSTNYNIPMDPQLSTISYAGMDIFLDYLLESEIPISVISSSATVDNPSIDIGIDGEESILASSFEFINTSFFFQCGVSATGTYPMTNTDTFFNATI
jgi:hypothetical protein